MTRPKNLDAFQIHYKMMITAGIWPKENPNIIYKMRTLTSWILSLGVTACMCMEAINDINNFTKLSEIVYILVTWIAYIIKLLAFMYHRKTFLHMIEFLDDPVFISYPDNFDRHVARAIKFITIIANSIRCAYLGCVVLYLIYPMLDNVPLPFPFPYDLGKYRLFMYAFQLVGEACAAWNNSCLDTLCTSLMGIAAVQLDILYEKIIALYNKEDIETEIFEISFETDQKVLKRVKQCIEHHLGVIKLIELIEGVFTFGLLAQFLASIVVFCNTLFQFLWVSLSWHFALLAIYFVAILLELFLYCWFGNEVILKSVKIGEACYMSNWHRCSKDVRKYLFIMMERSKRPLQITTYKFSVLSLASFGAILQWSYSCLTLLLNMYDKQVSEQ